jgi:hypothetical protein
MNFSEDFLCHIWRFRLFNTLQIFCESGERLEVLNPGILNRDAGPDFTNAKLRIGEVLWAGNVEVHLRSSDWLLHGHHHDRSYDSVILHVVYQYDLPIVRDDGIKVPVLVLKELFNESLFLNYTELVSNMNKFPCEKQLGAVGDITISSFLPGIAIERLEQKSAEVFGVLSQLKGNWDESFYRFLARNFGFKVNALPFELLAASLPQQILAKHKDNAVQIDALIFGQAGFLRADFEIGYPGLLKTEYQFLSTKYRLKNIDKSLWKFLRMRPPNFPTIRLAQFSGLIAGSGHLFSRVMEAEKLVELYSLFSGIQVNSFWSDHYHFDKVSPQVRVHLGLQSVQNILINTICLFLFSYGKYTDQQIFVDRAINFLEELPAEKNSIINYYSGCGLHPDNAFFSQALLQLNKCYCSQKKCLNCGIGIKILNK